MERPITYKWNPLEDLPDNFEDLASSELQALASVWKDQREQLKDSESLRLFNERLQREWAIETGIIENVYTLDRGITLLLIERGIDANLIPHDATNKDPELVAAIIRDHQEAMQWAFDFVGRNRKISVGYIKELHALITRHQETSSAVNTLGRQVEAPLLHGEYKKYLNNPVRPDGSIHEYAPPEQVASQMDHLIALCLEHDRGGVPPEVEAAWLHHRFTQIHPFQDGNGRVVRTLASLIFLRAGWFPLVITTNERTRYLDALEAADHGDLSPLVDLFAFVQKRAFVNALSIASDIAQRERVDQVIDGTRELLSRRREELWSKWEKAKEIAEQLREVASVRFNQVAGKMEYELTPLLPRSHFFVDEEPPSGDRTYFFRREIIESAKALDYFANPSLHASWLRLVMRTETQADVLLSFHGIGHEYRGLLVASMTFFRRTHTDSTEREVSDVATVSTEVFQINYREALEKTRARFERWLEEGLANALRIWQTGL